MKKIVIKIVRDGKVTSLYGFFFCTADAIKSVLNDEVSAVSVRVVG